MFGYVRLDSNTPKTIENNYKRHYCYLCHSLWKHYGFLSRLTDSFDVTFFLILLTNGDSLKELERFRCLHQSKKNKELIKSSDLSYKIASFNMVLVEAVLQDKIDDKDKWYAKIVYKIFKNKFKKLKKNNQIMWDIVHKGYKEMADLEKNNATLEEIENCFGNMIKEVVSICFDLKDEAKLSYLVYVAKMLYFMDALDDLDKDIKTNHYNPLKSFKSRNNLVNNNYKYLNEHLISLRKDVIMLKSNDINAVTVNRIVFLGIPEKLTKICLRNEE